MLTDQSTDAILAQFFNALTDAAFYLKAIRDDRQDLIDLAFAYSNDKGSDAARIVFEVNIGERMLGDNPERRAVMQPLFRQYAALLLTGEPQSFNFLSPVLQRVVHVTRSRMGDGILVIVREVNPQVQSVPTAFEPAELLSGILEASLNGIITYESIRDETGEIADFSFVQFNQAARRMLNLTDDTVGKPMLDQLPGVKEAGLFDKFVQVVETGQPLRFETPFPAGDVLLWYEMSVVKLGDGFVITFNDITNSKQATLQVEDQNALLQGILNTSLSNVFVYEAIRSKEGKIQDFHLKLANQTAREDVMARFGWDISNKNLSEIYPKTYETGQFDFYVKVTETGQPIRHEHFYPDAQAWYDTTITKLGDGCVVTGVNISRQKRAAMLVEQHAEENRRQAELLNSVLNSSPSGIKALEAVRDETGQIVDFVIKVINEAGAVVRGQPANELIGQRLLTVYSDVYEAGLFDHYLEVTNSRHARQIQVHYGNAWLDMDVAPFGDGVVVTYTDVTESKRVQQIIEQQAEENKRQAGQLQTVINQSQTAILLLSPVYDQAGTIIDFVYDAVNQTLADNVGRTPAEMIGTPISRWFPAYKSEGYNFKHYCEVFETGQSQRYEMHYHADGLDSWLDVAVARVGQQLVVTSLDHSSLKMLQQQLEASVLELQRSNANLEQFAYVASHDLQEPLRKIVAFGDILQNQFAPTLGKNGADIILRMQSAASRMQVLIRDVLAYSRVAAKRDEFKSLSLNQVVNDVLGDLETAIQDKKAVINVGSLPIITGDGLQLRQLFQNLISNALKFAKADTRSELNITSQLVQGRNTSISMPLLDADQWFYQINVEDNGIGFEPHQAERIFQVFQRLHNRNHYEGTGIGLAIVQKVVENHKGYVVAKGEPGKGAVFTILLPTSSN